MPVQISQDNIKPAPGQIQIRMETRQVKNPHTGESAPFQVPAHFSEDAAFIAATKYARKKGPGENDGKESGFQETARRLCKAWSERAAKCGIIQAQDQKLLHDDLLHLLLTGEGAPNSPQWFNTGLFESYGVKGGDRSLWHARLEPGGKNKAPKYGKAKRSQHCYENPLLSACFILSVQDDLSNPGGIMDTWARESRIFQNGAGSGANFSRIRHRGAPLSHGGTASGLKSFLEIGDRAAGAIRSGGSTRRAAKMVIVNADHPDVNEIIDWKKQEETKALALVKGAALLEEQNPTLYSGILKSDEGAAMDWRGEAVRTVSGQNANISVRMTDLFMKKALRSRDEVRQERPEGENGDSPADRPEAGQELQILSRMADAAWICADPGIQFDDTCNIWNPVLGSERIRGTNPCAEFSYIDDSACNLASLNLWKILDPDQPEGKERDDSLKACRKRVARLEKAAHVFTIMLETSVGLGAYPTREICENSRDHRPLGLGICGLGELLMRAGVSYASETGRNLAAAAAAVVDGRAKLTSSQIAKAVQPCAAFTQNRADAVRVTAMHAAHALQAWDPENPSAQSIRKEAESRADHREGFQRSMDTLLEEIGQPPKGGKREPQTAFARNLAQALCERAAKLWEEALEHVKKHGLRNMQTTAIAPTGTIGMLMDAGTTGIEPYFAFQARKTLAGGGSLTLTAQERSMHRALDRLGMDSESERGEAIQQLLNGEPTRLKESTLNVFRCAQPGSARALDPEDHVKMMAVLQPFVSGAISKTANLPEQATREDIEDIYALAWRKGLKALAIYRDNSKMSQPLASAQGKEKAAHRALKRGEREKLPPERDHSKTQKVNIGGTSVIVQASGYPDGRIGELFLPLDREGSTFRAILNGFSIIFSVALQYGTPLEALARALRKMRFDPQGLVIGDPQIKRVGSLFQFVAEKLNHWQQEFQRNARKERGGPAEDPQMRLELEESEKSGIGADLQGLGGPDGPDGFLSREYCPTCTRFTDMIQTGTCRVCTECKDSIGCS